MTWMELESIMLSEVRERQILYVCIYSHLHMESKEKTNTNSQKKKSDLWLTEAGVGEREPDEGGQRCQLPVVTKSWGCNLAQECSYHCYRC